MLLAVALAVLAGDAYGRQGRYRAVLEDGSRVCGDKLTGWGRPGRTVRLDDKVIQAPGKPLLWMRDSSLAAWRPEEQRSGYVEFFGGDRIVAKVIGGRPAGRDAGAYVPAHLALSPASTKRLYSHSSDVEIIRVLPGSVRRIVFQPGAMRRYQPGVLFARDGRRTSFLSVRWREDSVQLLLKGSMSTVRLADIVEIHMPKVDPWDQYYRDLAVLSPACESRLVRFETTDGLIATGSLERFGARAFDSGDMFTKADQKRQGYRRIIDRTTVDARRRRQDYEKARIANEKSIADRNAKIAAATEAAKTAEKNLIALHKRQEKEDIARRDAQRKKLEYEYRQDLREIEKRVARLPESKRESRRKTYTTAKNRTYQKALESAAASVERSKAKRTGELVKRRAELARTVQSILQKKGGRAQDARNLDRAAERLAEYEKRLETYRNLMAALPGPEGNSESWRHMVQPAWSLDPLWVPFNTIQMRWSQAPTKVPLSRVRPTLAVSPAMLGWRADRNADGSLLRSGGRSAGWGFGVHAHSELTFTLPPTAVSFQSRLGLDRLAGSGGCAQARVFIGSTSEKPVYESSLLIGSGKTFDTGAIRIPPPGKDPINLILQVDPVARNHPPQADPSNIRDKFDWLEPRITLDASRLRSEVLRYVRSDVSAWRGWTLGFDQSDIRRLGSWHDRSARGERGLFLPMLASGSKPLKLTREMKIAADEKWLVVDVGAADRGDVKSDAVKLRAGDDEISAEKIPVRQYWRSRRAPLVFAIDKYRGKNVKLELTQTPGGKDLYWRTIGVSKTLPGPYVLKRVLDDSGKGDMQVSRGLGLTLESGRIKKSYVLEALELYRLGAEVTFCNEATGQFRYEYLYGVMIGCDWKGGDKGFAALKDIRWVRNVLVSKDSGVSQGAADALKRAKGEDFRIKILPRTPSEWGGRSCFLTMRNRRTEDVAVRRIHGWGGFSDKYLLKPGLEMKIHVHNGFRFEAFASGANKRTSKPISRTAVRGDTVWEIK